MSTILFLEDILPDATELERIQFLASLCYRSSLADALRHFSKLKTEPVLFKPGHLTTHESSGKTFVLDTVPISFATFILHLNHPFYNTTQRSWRYCVADLEQPAYLQLSRDNLEMYTACSATERSQVIDFIQAGITVYVEHFSSVKKLVEHAFQQERPSATLTPEIAEKLTQEQLRFVLSTFLPTTLSYSADVVTIASMFHASGDHSTRCFTGKLLDALLQKNPELQYLRDSAQYDPAAVQHTFELQPTAAAISSAPELSNFQTTYSAFELTELLAKKTFFGKLSHPLDLLQFTTAFGDVRVSQLTYDVTMSLIAFGQDQRHRTIRRSTPVFLERQYIPPICQKIPKLVAQAQRLHQEWLRLFRRSHSQNLGVYIAPYGAQVAYTKSGDFLSIFHEQEKRCCWNAQLEISQAAQLFSMALRQFLKTDTELCFDAPCLMSTKCSEKQRFCGRPLPVSAASQRRLL